MKNILNLFVAVILFAVVIEAGDSTRIYKEDYLKKVEMNSLATMESDINALVESTIFNMIVFKSNVPSWKFDSILDKLNELSIEGKSASIRYKAQLASLFITYPNMFGDIKTLSGSDSAEIFKVIAHRIETNLLAAN